jgi:hypothetical protein
MVNESNAIRKNAFRLTWYMRGGINVDQMFNMSRQDIDSINEIIDDNMETTKKSKLPFF